MANKITINTELNDKVSKKLGTIGSAFDKTFGKGSSASLFGNIGAKGVAAGFGLLDSAISGTIGFLGDATKAAMDEEVSISKLNHALEANVAGWDGNTDAIEKVLAARMALGFSDDEQRQSLALLVVSTHNETLALEMQQTAMDLARLKGISLEEATTALIKTNDGGTRVLKALGITVSDNATQQEILTAVQKAAQGQAQAYADTTSGQLTVAQVKFGEAMEKIGTVILPVVADVLNALVGLLDALGPAMASAASALKPLGDAFSWLRDRIAAAYDIAWKLQNLVGGDTWRVGPHVPKGPNAPGITPHAEGGWAGLHGPELAMLGERGPEYVRKAGTGTGDGDGGGHGHPLYLDGRLVGEAMDERQYRLQRRVPTTVRA